MNCEAKWIDEWGGKIKFSHGSAHSRGTLVLFKPSFDITIESEICDDNGRFIILKVKIHDENFVLLNIYGPNKEKDKATFFSCILNHLITMNIALDENIIAVGDWNCIFNSDLDKSGGRQFCSNLAPDSLKKLISDLDLVDIWRVRYPTRKRFSFRQKKPLVQTRLDYFLITDAMQDNVVNVDIIPSVWSDHSAITMSIKHMQKQSPGNGYWKFNNSMLEDKIYVSEIKRNISKWKIEYKNKIDKRVVWELLKYEIRKFSKKYGALKKKERNREFDRLQNILINIESNLVDNDTRKEEYYDIKQQINSIEAIEAHGIFVRSKVQFIEENEKCTKYFFEIEKRNFIKKHIRKLTIGPGKDIIVPDEILEYEMNFYKELYTEQLEDSKVLTNKYLLQEKHPSN